MDNLNLNIDSQNLEQCLKEVWNWGGTTYQNICTGESNYVQWGNLDWLGMIILVAMGIAIALLILGVFISMIKMSIDY